MVGLPGSSAMVQILLMAPLSETCTTPPSTSTAYPKLGLFQKSNAMKRRLNTYWQSHRIDPDNIEAISDDEPEELMPDVCYIP